MTTLAPVETMAEDLGESIRRILAASTTQPGHCVNCNSNDHGVPAFTRLGTSWWRCVHCGDYYQHPRPDQAILATLRPQPIWSSYLLATGQRPARERLDEDLVNSHAKIGRDVLPYLRRRGSLLDVGAEAGAMVRLAKESNFVPEGLEVDAELRQLARSYNGVELSPEDITERPFRKASFDVITMHFFLERHPEPLEALLAANWLLRPTGVLIIETPTTDSTNFAESGEQWSLLRPLEQLHLFNSVNLANLVDRAGMRLLDLYSPGEDTMIVAAEGA